MNLETLPTTENHMKTIQPFLKWAGGKRQLLPRIRSLVPNKFKGYYEPFVGAGAVLFDLKPKFAVINDTNQELINCYKVIKESPDELIHDLMKHQNTSAYFYGMRHEDRSDSYHRLTPIERASRIIYLNKTCYNGLFRVNSKGHFNAPFGSYKRPNILNEQVIRSVSYFLNSNCISITSLDFAEATENAQRGDFVYLDPPYDPISDTASFTGYSLNQFDRNEQIRLQECFYSLTSRGCKVMLSNSSTAFIMELYRDFKIVPVSANRNINSVGTSRQKVEELIILNYAL